MISSVCKNKAFTLIELLVVIAIVGIISGFIIVAMTGASDLATDAKKEGEIDVIRKALLMYNALNGGYPIESECYIGNTCSNNFAASLVPNYLPSLPDEKYYKYVSDGNTFTLSVSISQDKIYSYNNLNGVLIIMPLSCPANWIDSGHGFCVMQWEAKIQGDDNGAQAYNASFIPESRSTGTPWVNISQAQAKAECVSIGAHLITNDEWMLLAHDIESVSSNYVSGILKRGNSGAVSSVEYNGGDPEAGATNSLATLSLPNLKTLNHFSGNVHERVDYTLSGAGSQPQSPNLTAWGYQEINVVSNWGNALSYSIIGPANVTLDSTKGVGKIYYKSDYTGTTSPLRGGVYYNGASTGIFAFSLADPIAINSAWGFRCVK